MPPPLGARARVERRGRVTARELQIIALAALGYSNLEIGVLLYISHETVKSHIRHALEKLRARNRAELVYRAIQDGLLHVTTSPEVPPPLSPPWTQQLAPEWSGEPEDLLRILSRE